MCTHEAQKYDFRTHQTHFSPIWTIWELPRVLVANKFIKNVPNIAILVLSLQDMKNLLPLKMGSTVVILETHDPTTQHIQFCSNLSEENTWKVCKAAPPRPKRLHFQVERKLKVSARFWRITKVSSKLEDSQSVTDVFEQESKHFLLSENLMKQLVGILGCKHFPIAFDPLTTRNH